MAKTANKAPAPTGVVHNVDLPFAFEDTPLPESAGRAGREPSILVRMFDAAPVGKTFFMRAEEPGEAVTDPAEREKVRQENARKLRMSTMNSVRHYLKKAGNENKKFGAVVDKANGGEVGVRVGRTA